MTSPLSQHPTSNPSTYPVTHSSISLPINPSIYPSTPRPSSCLHIQLPMHPPIHPSLYPFSYSSIHLPSCIHLFIHLPPIYPPIHLSTHPPTYLTTSPRIYQVIFESLQGPSTEEHLRFAPDSDLSISLLISCQLLQLLLVPPLAMLPHT